MTNPYESRRKISGDTCQYTLNWSPYVELDRYLVHGVIPSEGGIFQIYVNIKGQLHFIHSEMSHYGGLRNRIRELMDPLFMGANPHKKTIENQQCFVRYSVFASIQDMKDVMYHLTGSEPSGRYADIQVHERECLQVRRA